MTFKSLQNSLQTVAFTTPTLFTEDGQNINHEKIRCHARTLLDAGGKLFVPCGNTGEYYSLSNEERVQVVETIVDEVGDNGAVVAGAGGSTKNAIELINQYEDVGVDGVMIMHPHHTYIHEKGLERYYRKISNSTDLGMIIYKRGKEVSDATILSLVDVENIVGIKYAVDDVKSFSKLVEASPDDICWINGIAEPFAPSFALEGAIGFSTGIGNFLPKESLALMKAIRDRDWEHAKYIKDILRPFEDLREGSGAGNSLVAANNVPGVKYGMELAGEYGGPVREPLVALSESDKERAREYYEQITAAGIKPN